MAKSSAYEPVLSSKASLVLIGLPKTKQRKIVRLLFQLAEHPGPTWRLFNREEGGRDIQHIKISDRHFSY